MAQKNDVVWEAKATAEDLAKKVAEIMREELVGMTAVEGNQITFRLAGGQTFQLLVSEL